MAIGRPGRHTEVPGQLQTGFRKLIWKATELTQGNQAIETLHMKVTAGIHPISYVIPVVLLFVPRLHLRTLWMPFAHRAHQDVVSLCLTTVAQGLRTFTSKPTDGQKGPLKLTRLKAIHSQVLFHHSTTYVASASCKTALRSPLESCPLIAW